MFKLKFTMMATLAVTLVLAGCGGKGKSVPDDPVGTINAVTDGLTKNEPGFVWAAMPASYQKDVSGLVHSFAEKMDADVYDKAMSVMKKVVDIVEEKKEFILNSPMMPAGGDKAESEKAFDAGVKMLDTIVDSDLESLDKLKKLDVGKFLNGTGAKLMQQMADAAKLTPGDEFGEVLEKLKGTKAELVKEEGDKATVKMTTPGEQPHEMAMVKVEGKWVPAEVAQDWDHEMKEARETLEMMDMSEQKMPIMAMLGMVESTLDTIKSAQTQAEFDQAVQQIGMMLPMMGGGMGGPQPDIGGPPEEPPFELE